MTKRNKEEQEDTDVKEMSSAELGKLLIKELNKEEEKLGKMAWNLAFDADNPTDVKEFISTGSTLLDYCVANKKGGGVPVGKLTEISGEEASGKSLMVAHLIAETQKRGGIAALIDSESAVNPDFLRQLGVKVEELIYVQAPTVEDVGSAIEKIIIMVRTKAPNKLCLIAWDSIANSSTKKELEGEFELSMDLQLEKSKVLSKMMRKLTDVWGKERIAMVFTNQLKTKIGVMYGDPMTTPGGKAVPYLASVRIRLEKGVSQKDVTDQVYGIHTRAKVFKNRLGPPLRKCEFDILFSTGIDDVQSWFQKLHELGEIELAKGWCYLSSLPSGKIEEDGVNKGKDRGVQFREKKFTEMVKTNQAFAKRVDEILQKWMIVKYGEKPNDMEIDTESLLDMETAVPAAMKS